MLHGHHVLVQPVLSRRAGAWKPICTFNRHPASLFFNHPMDCVLEKKVHYNYSKRKHNVFFTATAVKAASKKHIVLWEDSRLSWVNSSEKGFCLLRLRVPPSFAVFFYLFIFYLLWRNRLKRHSRGSNVGICCVMLQSAREVLGKVISCGEENANMDFIFSSWQHDQLDNNASYIIYWLLIFLTKGNNKAELWNPSGV